MGRSSAKSDANSSVTTSVAIHDSTGASPAPFPEMAMAMDGIKDPINGIPWMVKPVKAGNAEKAYVQTQGHRFGLGLGPVHRHMGEVNGRTLPNCRTAKKQNPPHSSPTFPTKNRHSRHSLKSLSNSDSENTMVGPLSSLALDELGRVLLACQIYHICTTARGGGIVWWLSATSHSDNQAPKVGITQLHPHATGIRPAGGGTKGQTTITILLSETLHALLERRVDLINCGCV